MEQQVRELYQLKCSELELQILEEAEDKFVDQFYQSVVEDKSLHFANFGFTHNCISLLCSMMSPLNYSFLDLSFNKLLDDGAFELAKFIRSDPCLVFLDLRSNAIDQKGMRALFSALSENTHIAMVDFSAMDGINRNRIETEGCKSFAKCLLRNRVLSEINLAATGITAKGAEYIGYGINHNNTLISIDISCNGLESRGIEAMLTNIPSKTEDEYEQNNEQNHGNENQQQQQQHQNDQSENPEMKNKQVKFNRQPKSHLIRTVGVSRNGSNLAIKKQPPTPATLKAKARSINFAKHQKDFLPPKTQEIDIRSFGGLEEINLSKNSINNKCSKTLRIALCKSKQMKRINLSHNSLGKQFLEQLLIVIQNGSQLESINLAKNNIDAECSDALQMLIKSFVYVKEFNLSSNQLRDKVLTQLVPAFEENKSITHLDLSNTSIGNKGAKEIAEILENNTTLQVLNLNSNSIGDDGGVALANSLLKNNTLTELYLRNNELADRAATAFIDAIHVNTKIVTLDVQYNDFSYSALAKIRKGLKEHSRRVDRNVPSIAREKIDELTAGENELKNIKQGIKDEEYLLKSSLSELEGLRLHLIDLQKSKSKEIQDKHDFLDKVTQELEDLRDESADKQTILLNLKQDAENEERDLSQQLIEAKHRADASMDRYKIAEEKKQRVKSQCFSEVEEMKLQLNVLKSDLLNTLKQCHMEQAQLIAEKNAEEDRLAAQAADALLSTQEMDKMDEDDPTLHALKNLESMRQLERSNKKKGKRRKRGKQSQPSTPETPKTPQSEVSNENMDNVTPRMIEQNDEKEKNPTEENKTNQDEPE